MLNFVGLHCILKYLKSKERHIGPIECQNSLFGRYYYYYYDNYQVNKGKKQFHLYLLI